MAIEVKKDWVESHQNEKTSLQKSSFYMGEFLILFSLLGTLFPGLLMMHLSPLHNGLHLLSGLLLMVFGRIKKVKKTLQGQLIIGAFYCLLGFAGFYWGDLGFPFTGYQGIEYRLIKIIPKSLEFGTADHLFHLILGFVLIGNSWIFRRHHT